MEAVLFDQRYRVLRKKRVFFRKQAHDPEVRMPRREVLKMFTDLIAETKAGHEIAGIGISIPDIITANGTILGKSKIRALDDFPLGPWLKKAVKCDVVVRNDADCFALGEFVCGAGKGNQDMVGVIWGTGIGAGVILDGHLYRGAYGSAGEFGHNTVDPNGPVCRCGTPGCVEAFAGGPNIVANYLAAGGDLPDATPKTIYSAKSAVAKQAMSDAILAMGKGLAQLANILSIQFFVLGGGLSNLEVYAALTKAAKKYTRDGLRDRIKIVKNKLGDSAGVYGAAYLVFSGDRH
jgi:fructokinase